MIDGRKAFLAKLDVYTPYDRQENEYKKRIRVFIATHEDCFERTQQAGHVTASAWLLDKTGNKALLMHHAKLGLWVQPGGHCDGNPDVLAVAIKEAQEESGIQDIRPVTEQIFDVDVHHIPATKKEPEHYHYDVRFLLQVCSDEDLIKNEESHELRWISKDPSELPTTERSVVRLFEKWIKRPR